MSHSHSVLLIWLGGAGLAEFGSLWLAVKGLDAGSAPQTNRDRLDGIIGRRRRRRIDRWTRIAPLLAIVSMCLLIAGVILRYAAAF